MLPPRLVFPLLPFSGGFELNFFVPQRTLNFYSGVMKRPNEVLKFFLPDLFAAGWL
jgi:hypothetical protein